MLSIHINYDPFMYQYHLGILAPKRDRGLEIDRIKTKWEETQFIILGSMRPKRVWNNTRKARYTVSINWYRAGQDKTEVKAAQQTLVTMTMSKTNYHTGCVEECQF